MTDTTSVQTSVPDWLMTYCRQLAEVHCQRKLNRMYVHMLQCFLAHAPWKANPPFAWRAAKIHRASGVGGKSGVDMGWTPMNMTLPAELVDQIKHIVEGLNVDRSVEGRALSLRTFLYTAVCWWCICVYPYKGPGMLPD